MSDNIRSMQGDQVGASRPELRALTGIRALAAGWVVLTHLQGPLFTVLPWAEPLIGDFVRAGWLGVEVFFVLSGFIIAYNYADRFKTFSASTYRSFLFLRFARIYPVHLVTFLAMVVLIIGATMLGVHLKADAQYTVPSFFANLFMLQAVPPFWAWNGPAWSISTEFAAYAVFPIIGLWLARLHTTRAALISLSAVLVVGVGGIVTYAIMVNPNEAGYAIIWLRIGTEFVAGALLYVVWATRRVQISNRWDWVSVASIVGTLAVVAIVGGEGVFAIIALPFITLLILGTAGSAGWFHRLLATRVMLWGGRTSYSVYMTHMIVIMVAGDLVPWENLIGNNQLTGIAVLVAIIGVIIAAGAVCYHLVEEPGRRALRKLAARGATRQTAE